MQAHHEIRHRDDHYATKEEHQHHGVLEHPKEIERVERHEIYMLRSCRQRYLR
jgi:hypothetical protein